VITVQLRENKPAAYAQSSLKHMASGCTKMLPLSPTCSTINGWLQAAAGVGGLRPPPPPLPSASLIRLRRHKKVSLNLNPNVN
jgi:hypothetical protein